MNRFHTLSWALNWIVLCLICALSLPVRASDILKPGQTLQVAEKDADGDPVMMAGGELKWIYKAYDGEFYVITRNEAAEILLVRQMHLRCENILRECEKQEHRPIIVQKPGFWNTVWGDRIQTAAAVSVVTMAFGGGFYIGWKYAK